MSLNQPKGENKPEPRQSLRIPLVYSFQTEIAPEHVISESKLNRTGAIHGGK